MATIRLGLVKEVVSMAFDTVRTNKMRSGLTVLGIVIGITAIVGMTALIRGSAPPTSSRSCRSKPATSSGRKR